MKELSGTQQVLCSYLLMNEEIKVLDIIGIPSTPPTPRTDPSCPEISFLALCSQPHLCYKGSYKGSLQDSYLWAQEL